jgi:hypothetical protein
MGCGASQQRDDPAARQDAKQPPTPAAKVKPEAARISPRDAYAPDPSHDLEDNDEHPVVTVAVMSELRTRSRDMQQQQGSTVQRWIESITEPTENDATDVYDPARRHALSMESLHNRLNSEA